MPLSRLAILKNKRLKVFIDFALREGWQVELTPEGNIRLQRKGYATVCNAAFVLENAPQTALRQIQSTALLTEKAKRVKKAAGTDSIHSQGGQDV